MAIAVLHVRGSNCCKCELSWCLRNADHYQTHLWINLCILKIFKKTSQFDFLFWNKKISISSKGTVQAFRDLKFYVSSQYYWTEVASVTNIVKFSGSTLSLKLFESKWHSSPARWHSRGDSPKSTDLPTDLPIIVLLWLFQLSANSNTCEDCTVTHNQRKSKKESVVRKRP
jgi:hypothetical protein